MSQRAPPLLVIRQGPSRTLFVKIWLPKDTQVDLWEMGQLRRREQGKDRSCGLLSIWLGSVQCSRRGSGAPGFLEQVGLGVPLLVSSASVHRWLRLVLGQPGYAQCR